MNKSEISDGFNFDYELDITQNRRDKTDQYFSKEGFAFEDFMNIGDKTMKSDKMSSKYYNNTSNIFKPDQDSYVSPHNIIDNLTEHSLKVKKRETSVLENLSVTNPPENILRITSPKFADELGTSKTIQELSKKEFTLRRTETAVDKTNINEYLQKQNSSKGIAEAFKKKDNPASKAKEEQYKQLQTQIKYYTDSLEKMIYQSQRMEDQTENLMANFNSESYEIELDSFAKESKAINKEIEEERNLEVQLNKMINQLEDQYQELINSVKSLNFPRPVKMLDQTKAIVDEINSLKAEFDALERDDGSLNLSSTLLHNYSTNQPGNTFRGPQKKDSTIGLSRIQQIYAQNKRSEDPRFLHNIKMACLRDEWSIYSNSEVQINVSYRNCPKIKITLGNKFNKDLEKFTFLEGSTTRLEGETISAKSYITHQIEIKEDLIEELFIRCQLSYQVQNNKKSVVLFIPTGMTTFGEFSPITEKEFLLDAGKDEFQNNGNYRPLDKKLANNITQIEYYMPNLLIDRDNYKCFGLFVSIFNDFTFLVLRQRGELVSVSAKTPNWPLIRMLEFIFTL